MRWQSLLALSHVAGACGRRDGGHSGEFRSGFGADFLAQSVMLSDPATEFTGGEFTTLENDQRTVNRFPGFKRGDGIVFVSEKWHSVQVVESGARRSLVTEIWAGPRELEPSNRYAF